MRKFSRIAGFTLLELMITVAVVAILATVATESYRGSILRSHRTEAKTALLSIQVAQEKYFLQNNAYGTLANLGATNLGLKDDYTTTNGYYAITLPTLTSTTYLAKATAAGGQADDTTCLEFNVAETGTKTATSANCWAR